MKRRSLVFAVLFLSLLPIAGAAAGNEPSQDEMRTEVSRLVKAAEELTTLWPWSGPVPEVARVAAYGKPIAPLLVDLLADDPESVEEPSQKIDLHVQQQAALALCKIYGVT